MSKLYAAQSLVLQRLEISTDIPCEYVVSGKDCTERVEPAKDRRDSDAIFPFGTIRNSMSAVQLARCLSFDADDDDASGKFST